MYSKPGSTTDSWKPEVLGLQKRDLLRDALAIWGMLFMRSRPVLELNIVVAKNSTLKKLATDSQGMLVSIQSWLYSADSPEDLLRRIQDS